MSRPPDPRAPEPRALEPRDAERRTPPGPSPDAPPSPFLTAPVGALLLRTAPPIIFVTAMNGLLAVVDALFLGHWVGADALAAVTLMFPAWMAIVASATLVGSGMASELARALGAGRTAEARGIFAGAHGLALVLAAGLIGLFLLAGRPAALAAAAGDAGLAGMGLDWLRVLVLASPLAFVLSVNSDALRTEGRAGFMAVGSLIVTTANIAFDWVAIVHLGLGVAGAAWATVAAQGLALAVILGFRLRGRTALRPSALRSGLGRRWGRMLALGAPPALGYVGLAAGSASILAALQLAGATDLSATVSAYGIVTRVVTFAVLPLIGLMGAMQAITGANRGAGLHGRAEESLARAALAALAWCAAVQLVVVLAPGAVAAVFVDDPVVIAEVARILPVMSALFVLAGPQMMVAGHFQAIGDAPRAALLGLSKPWLFAIPLTFLLSALFGEPGVWAAGPAAEGLMLLLTLAVLAQGRGAARGAVA